MNLKHGYQNLFGDAFLSYEVNLQLFRKVYSWSRLGLFCLRFWVTITRLDFKAFMVSDPNILTMYTHLLWKQKRAFCAFSTPTFYEKSICYVLLKMEIRLPCTYWSWWYFDLISNGSPTVCTYKLYNMNSQRYDRSVFTAAWDKKPPEFWQLQLQIGHRGTKSWCQNSKPNKMLVLALFLLSSVQPLPRQASDEVKLDLETLILNKTCLKK